MAETTMRLRLWVKSISASARVRMPMEAIIPKRSMEIPPSTPWGRVWRRAESLGMKARRMAKPAAMRRTKGSYTRVTARTPVFSE